MLKMTPLRWGNLRYFKPSEFWAPDDMDYVTLHKLDQLRHLIRRPVLITSSNEPNDKRSPESSHNLGCAVDVACTSDRHRFTLVEAAYRVGFRRIGVYDKHVHLDDNRNKPHSLWTGVSR